MVKKSKKILKREERENTKEVNTQAPNNNFDFKNFLIIFLTILVIYFAFFENTENKNDEVLEKVEAVNTTQNITSLEKTEENEEEESSYLFFSSYFEKLNENLGLKFPIVSPIFDIFFISFFTSLLTVYLSKIVIGKEGLERRKLKREELKLLRKKQMDLIKTNPNKAKDVNAEIMKVTMESFKESFNIKLILITMPIIFFIFPFLSFNYSPYTNILFGFGWLGTYIVFSVLNSLVLNKLFKLH